MSDSEYPNLGEHRERHLVFEKEVGELSERIASAGYETSALVAFHDRIVNWLLDHIAGTDGRYGKFAAENLSTEPGDKSALH